MLTVILAGGQSRRMGRDKPLLGYEGETLLRRLIRRYAALGPVAVSVDRPGRYAFPDALELPDPYPGQGPLNGLVAGFRATGEEELFLTAADLPLGDPALARKLQALRLSHDACVVLGEHGPEPLFAVYGRTCLPAAEAAIAAGERSMRRLLARLDVCYVNQEALPEFPFAHVLFNVNTPEDYNLLIKETDPWQKH